jgi:hypothetical protein
VATSGIRAIRSRHSSLATRRPESWPAGICCQTAKSIVGDDVTVNANGTFAFPTPLAAGSAFAVTVKQQPTDKWQTCTVTQGGGGDAGAADGGADGGGSASGVIATSNITNLSVVCTTNILTTVESGKLYAVTVKTQPNGVPNEVCSVAAGAGTFLAADINTVAVSCSARTKVMVCGSSSRDITTFFPQNSGLTKVDSCVPDATTLAILVTRNGVTQFNAAGLKTWVEAGGIALTETFSTDEVYNAVFGTALANSSSLIGGCQDIIPRVVQFTPGDPVFAAVP